MSGELLRLLTGLGIEVHCFTTARETALPDAVRSIPGLHLICMPSPWTYDKWYSRTDFTKFATGMPARARAFAHVGSEIARLHADNPFDLIYLFNAADVTALRGHLSSLPRVVLHPEVHAAGELTWLQRERHLAASGGRNRASQMFFEAVMTLRAASQRRGVQHASMIIAPSQRFARLLANDYGVPMSRIRIVPNPIDLKRFSPSLDCSTAADPASVRLLYVSRIAVRKGVEQIVALSHRLADLDGLVKIEIVGAHSLWSDYRHLLAMLNERIASYTGPIHGSEMSTIMRASDVFLCPSLYEPFGLTVGEALASGMAVVASDAVGAAEELNTCASEAFHAGDLPGFERAVRTMVRRFQADPAKLRAGARLEASRLFGPEAVSDRLRAALMQ